MALWQYAFHIFTKESFDSLHLRFPLSLAKFGFDDEAYWQFKAIDKSYFYDIGVILKKGKSWSNEIDLYGNQESNCLEVFFDSTSNVIKSVSFRIDFTSNYEIILRNIIEFCILKKLIILDENLQAVVLNYEIAKSIIENAPQKRKYNKLRK